MPPKIQKRSRGQTVVYEDWEWVYDPYGIKDSTWAQIVKMRREGHPIRVIQWPKNEDAVEPAWLEKIA